MVHFDSTGAYITPFFNYHDNPHAFVRLILGLTTTDESVLGLDTTIQWTIQNGMKASGKISVPQDNVDKPLVKGLPFETSPTGLYARQHLRKEDHMLARDAGGRQGCSHQRCLAHRN